MDMTDFSQNAAKFLADTLQANKFNLADEKQFYKFPTAMNINGLMFNIYSYHSVLSFKVNKDNPDDLVYFTFFVSRAEDSEKAKFMAEVEKQKAGQPVDQVVLDKYMSAFTPSSTEYQNLCNQLKTILETKIYEGQGFDFSVLFTAPDGDLDPIIVFLENNSVKKLQEKHPQELVLNPSL